jgi:hypothetical protein
MALLGLPLPSLISRESDAEAIGLDWIGSGLGGEGRGWNGPEATADNLFVWSTDRADVGRVAVRDGSDPRPPVRTGDVVEMFV